MASQRWSRAQLTTRGRAFLAGGATIVLCAALLGQAELVRIGVLVLALPALSWLAVGLRRLDVTARRLVARPVVAAGALGEVELIVRMPRTGTLLVEEQLPHAFGSRPRYVLSPTADGAEHALRYTVSSDVRGKFTLGPLTTRRSDPFGLVEVRRTVAGTATITVTPRMLPLRAVGLGGGRTGSGERHVPVAAAGAAEDVTVREYRRGDDLRRVHWRSSARVGELMVRREEHPWEARATILLDDRAAAHAGHGSASSFETAVTIAASVAVHLDQRGYAVRLATSRGLVNSGTEQVSSMLEHLAVIAVRSRGGLDIGWCGEPGRTGIVIGVFGHLTEADAAPLRRLRRESTLASAFALDIRQWEKRVMVESQDTSSAAVLRDHGWRAAPVGRRTAIEQAWRDLTARVEVRR